MSSVCKSYLEVKSHSEGIQRKEGDCLVEGYISVLLQSVHVDLSQNNISELEAIWKQWRMEKKESFSKKYGDVALLMSVKVDEQLMRPAIQFWDPSYQCFVFNQKDLAPTIEEYSSLLRIESTNQDKIYWKEHKTTGYRKKLAKIMQVEVEEIDKHKKEKNRVDIIPSAFLLEYIRKYIDTDQGSDVFALAIYGLMIFPKIKKPFLGKRKTSFRPFSVHFSPIKEFMTKEWRKDWTKSQWLAFFLKLTSEDVTWRAPWMLPMAILYSCGDESWVPLLGIWGAVSYAPLMVQRQYDSRQFIPMTHRLGSLEFEYGTPGYMKRVREIIKAWKQVNRMSPARLADNVAEGYLAWRMKRVNEIRPLPADVSEKLSAPVSVSVLSTLEIAQREFEIEKKRLKKEKVAMMDQVNQLRYDLMMKNDAVQKLTKERKVLKEDLQDLHQENKKLRLDSRPLKGSKKDVEELRDMVKYWKNKARENKEMIFTLTKEQHEWKEKLSGASEKVTRHQRESEKLKAELMREQSKNSDLQSKKKA
ncbi:uncharacterized protein LOC111275424 [Durio zibethinus]|uniref:Uncharacterized protein LOC111275424 n=1 Tax=Durio zibethinus TaxID=66656 RepID=A0A6P5WM66_DURZI|nr:uncharacterized protein LOC111275424 [Durio zibethinus]